MIEINDRYIQHLKVKVSFAFQKMGTAKLKKGTTIRIKNLLQFTFSVIFFKFDSNLKISTSLTSDQKEFPDVRTMTVTFST